MTQTTPILHRFISLEPGVKHSLGPGVRSMLDVVEARCAVFAQVINTYQFILDDSGDHTYFPDLSLQRYESNDWLLLKYQGDGALRRMVELQLAEPRLGYQGAGQPLANYCEVYWTHVTYFGHWLEAKKLGGEVPHPLGPRREAGPAAIFAPTIEHVSSLLTDCDEFDWLSSHFPVLDGSLFVDPQAHTPAGEAFLAQFDVQDISFLDVLCDPSIHPDEIATMRGMWMDLPDHDAADVQVALGPICAIYLRFSDGAEFHVGAPLDEFHPALQRGMARLRLLCASGNGEDLQAILFSIGSAMDLGAHGEA